MSGSRFGQHFQISSFGESHGKALGALIEGCPSGVHFDESLLLNWLTRRRPGHHSVVSARVENDMPEVLSGVYEGVTLGTPIAILIRNQDARSEDYDLIKKNPRAGHADDVWVGKYGHVDHRGGGRASGRETVARVLGGAVAQMMIRELYPQFSIHSHAAQVGPLVQSDDDYEPEGDWGLTAARAKEIQEFLEKSKSEGQSYGGVAEIHLQNVPPYLGQPVFNKIKADLAAAMLSVGAVSGFDFGSGFSAVATKGSDFHSQAESEVYGGIRGGLTTGEPISFRVAFKPTSSILDVAKKGRHDPCVLLRALPVLEAMTYLVFADHILWSRLDRVR